MDGRKKKKKEKKEKEKKVRKERRITNDYAFPLTVSNCSSTSSQ